MKKDKIIYWISTVLVAFSGLSAGIMYFTAPESVEGFAHLGFPDYFRKELGVAKLLGGLAVIVPMIPARVKEWAYAGFGITFISAIIAHSAVDGISTAMGPAIAFAILVVSYIYFHKLQGSKT